MVDRLITLFESDDTTFTTNGLGSLMDAISCTVTEERNNIYELEMVYPVSGAKFSEIMFRRLLFVKPNPFKDKQAFRVYNISKPLDGKVTIYAKHISYDLSGYTAAPFIATSVNIAFENLVNACDTTCPFTFWTDKDTSANMQTKIPLTVRSILGGIEGSILDTYRGEYEFDNFTVKLWNNRGSDKGVTIRYGKNLTSLQQEENCSNVYTAVRPYWYKETDDGSGGLVTLPEKIVNVGGDTPLYTKVLPLDLTDQFDDRPTEAQLRESANDYINNHNLDTPEVSLDVSFVQLTDTTEYRDIALLERVELCDTVTVEFPKLGVSAKAEVIKTEYDVLAGKYLSISLGTPKATISTTISNNQKTVEQAIVDTKSTLEASVEHSGKLITGNLGGNIVLYDINGDGKPEEFLVLDTDNPGTATNVWRWNSSGLGHSDRYEGGDFNVAITMDGRINANMITVGTMLADMIKGGNLILGSNEGVEGVFKLQDEANKLIGQFDKNGLTMYGPDGTIVMNYVDGFAGKDKNNTKIYWASKDEFHMKKAVVENEITLCGKMRFISIQTGTHDGIGLVSVV